MVYKDGRWIDSLMSSTDHENTLLRRAQSDWAVLNLLPTVSNTEAQSPTIKFFDSEITHAPWKMELGRCRIVAEPRGIRRPDGVMERHLAVESCALSALGRWFDWMKQNGVYENTNIIIVSDHGSGDTAQFFKGLGRDLYQQVRRPDSLLLYKPVGKTEEPLAENGAHVQISDVGEWLKGAAWGQSHAVRELFLASPTGTRYTIDRKWQCTGNIYQKESWKRVQP